MSQQFDDFKRIIRECNYDNTYKVAWAKALVELSSELPLVDVETEITLVQIAEKYLKYYWNQTIFFDFAQSTNKNRPPEVVTNVKALINSYYEAVGNKKPISFEQAITRLPERDYYAVLGKIVGTLKKNVSYRFLNLDGRKVDIYKYTQGDEQLWISTSLLREFKKNKNELFDLIDYRWGMILENINSSTSDNRKVKIEGEQSIERMALAKYKHWVSFDKPKRVRVRREAVNIDQNGLSKRSNNAEVKPFPQHIDDGGDKVTDVQVGKYTLESLTTGMYSDPKIVYREYIQNSVDSLENAVASGLIDKQSMRIDITINEEESYISFRDNGTGISNLEAPSSLLNVGSSKKRNSNNRGFRGIGRLGGMSYCDYLVFTTSAEGEDCKTVITFDCKKLRKILVPGEFEDLSLSDVLASITTIDSFPEKKERHFFLVEMKNVSGSSDLLNVDAAKSYISQVAPLPYLPKRFIYTNQLKDYLEENGYLIEEFPIFVGENEAELEAIYKPNKSRFRSDRNKKKEDELTSLSYFDITVDGELYALGWYGNCNWYGYLSERELAGLRVRKGNILIGDSKTLNPIFKEPRFNGWAQGEVFIVTDKLIPNARRDDFEQNEAYYKFMDLLSESVAPTITKEIRAASTSRNDPSRKLLNDTGKKVQEAAAIVSEGFNSTYDKEKLVDELKETVRDLEQAKVKEEFAPKKEELKQQLEQTIEQVSTSNNYKVNKINSGIDKKSKQVIKVITEVLSRKLSKFLVDEIMEEIIDELNGK